jgi:hypothetical protein
VPFRPTFYHRYVPLLFPLPALIRSVPIPPGGGGRGLGEKGQPRREREPAGLARI